MLIASWSKDSESRDEQFAEARISWWKSCLGESLSRWASLSDKWTWLKNTGWVFPDHELCEGSVIPGSPLARRYLLSSSVYSAWPSQSPWACLGGSPGTALPQSFFEFSYLPWDSRAEFRFSWKQTVRQGLGYKFVWEVVLSTVTWGI